MKKIIALLIVYLCFSSVMKAQVTVFSETFDSASVSMTSTGNPGFTFTNTYFSSPAKSAMGNFNAAGQATLESPSFSTAGNNFVLLSFDHICKVSFFDSSLVEYSIDNGTTWTTFNASNCNYTGSSPVYASLFNFSAGAYSVWDFTNATSMSNSWWQTESYDVSASLGNQSSVKIRFRMRDDGSGNGMQNFTGWFLDNIAVVMSPCELIAPSISLKGFTPNGITFGTGPFTINALVKDANSGVDTTVTTLHYTITNGGAGNSFAVAMQVVGGAPDSTLFTADIPLLAAGDTVCYYVSAGDLCGNTDSTAVICAYISTGITIPFVDGFDSGNSGWSDSTASGSSWELGTPAFGQTTGALSNPNAWDVALNSAYLSSTNCFLYSPVFDFTAAANAKLSFYQNYFAEAGWDGVRMEVSSNHGNGWLLLGSLNDPLGTNWYNSVINSSAMPAWNGSSPGWVHSEYQLNAYSGIDDVRFRFVFTSDVSIEKDGYSIDDFSIVLPLDYDLEATAVAGPASAPAGSVQSGTAVISNIGALSFPSYQVAIVVNGTAVDTIDMLVALPSGSNNTITFSYTVPAGSYTLCATIIAAQDMLSTNNTYCINGLGVPTENIPYFNDFETSGSDWEVSQTNAFTKWEYGTPAYGATTGSFSGLQCWDVNLNQTYSDNSTAYVYTPYFSTGALSYIRVGFYSNFNLFASFDGVTLEYELNQSGIWVTAGGLNDPSGMNWYNNLLSPAQTQFSGNSGGWKKSFLNILTGPSNTVRFRFVFRSGVGGIQLDGFSVDDFSVIAAPDDDIGVLSILGLTTVAGISKNPQLMLKNYGVSAQSGFDVSYDINGTLQGTGIYSGILSPGQTDTISLPAFTVPAGAFGICGYTQLSTDTDNSNDTLCGTGHGVSTVQLPYTDDFEGQDLWTVETTGSPLTNWERGYPNFGVTTGTHSGNNCWDTNLDIPYDVDAYTMLVSPYFDFTNAFNDTLFFWQNYFDEQPWDGVRLEYDTNASGNWTVLGTYNDPAGTLWYNNASLNSSGLPGWTDISTGWVQSKYPLASIGNPGIVQFRFVFTSDASVVHDGHSIDDFSILNALANDIAVTTVNSIGNTVTANAQVNLDVTIQNAGMNAASGFNIYYSLNGAAPVMQSFAGSLASFASVNVNLGNIIPVAGNNTLKIYTDLSNDMNRNNDTLLKVMNAIPAFTLPYSDDFENSSSDWTVVPSSTGSTQWEWGMPAWGSTSSVHGGAACWDVNLMAPYGNLANTQLISPIINYSNATQTTLSFWANYNTEFGADGCQLQYTTNDVTWNVLGTFNDPNGTNWYDMASVNAFSSQSAWSGNTAGWRQITYNTAVLEGLPYVRFRFLFKSDINLSADGMSVDDFSITGIVSINETDKSAGIQVYPNPADDILYINSSEGIESVQLFNSEGKLIRNNSNEQNRNLKNVDLSGLAPGLYFVKVFTEQNVFSGKVIKK
jgi:hypothetical protein